MVTSSLKDGAHSTIWAATERCPLLAVIKAADGLASHILEAL